MYNIIDALKDNDTDYILFMLKEYYYDHIDWRIHHYIKNERCENCRNWHYAIRINGRDSGTCDVYENDWEDYHGYCKCHNIDMNENENYCRDDGCERYWNTHSGKVITQFSRGGIWQYKHDGCPEWCTWIK